MLTIKQILDDKDAVIRGLEKKHFEGAAEAIEAVLAADNRRREAQQQMDELKAQVNQISKSIGALMKEGRRDEAEQAKARVAEIKLTSARLEEQMKQATEERTQLLLQIPNLPYPEVPEGKTAEDNLVVKTGGELIDLPHFAVSGRLDENGGQVCLA